MAENPIPIRAYRIGGGASEALPEMRRLAEKAAQTFLTGVPVVVDATGYITESPAIAAAGVLVAGISSEYAHNLGSSGVAKTLTYGSVQNQANAVLIPGGAPPSDGNVGVMVANDDTEFVGQCNSAHNLAVTDVGVIYGLTKGANNQWYIDTTIATLAAGAVVLVTELVDPVGTAGGKVAFKFIKAAQQLNQ